MQPIAISEIVITARTAVVKIAEPLARFRLSSPRGFRLEGGRGIREGFAERVVTVLDGLSPDTDYRFVAEGCAAFAFRTPTCAGVIDASDIAKPGEEATAAFQSAIDALPPGGTLFFPAGEWVSGPLFLKSDMTLHLAAGSRLKAIGDRERIPILDSHRNGRVLGSWEGEPARTFAAILTAVDCRRLAVTGTGTIDGGGDRGDWWQWPKETRQGAHRPRTVHLIGCEDVVLAGPTIENSPSWTVHPYGCRRLVVAGLSVRNPHDSPNTDGLDPESCEDVRIEGVHFSVGDDCIAIKAGKRRPGDNSHLAPTRGIAVRNCLMERGHGGVVLGSEMSGGIHDVVIEDCEMVLTDRGLRIKTRRGRGGAVSGVVFRRVVMDGVESAVTANAFYFCDVDGHEEWVQSRAAAPCDETTPTIADILVEDVELKNIRLAVAALLGLPEAPLKGLRLERVKASFDPAAVPGVPLMADHVRAVRHAGILFEQTELATVDCPSAAEGLSI